MPPAFVATFPPIVQLPRAPKSSGKSKFLVANSSWSLCKTTPACTVATPSWLSIASISVRRSSDKMTSSLADFAPATTPVKPPCITTL